MDIGLVSLIVLVAVVIIGFVRKVNVGVLAITIASTIGMISSCAGFSPASTVGAVIMGTYEGDKAVENKKPANKLFIELFAWSVFCVFFFALLSFLGVFSLIG